MGATNNVQRVPRASVAPGACTVTLHAIWIWTWSRRRAGQGGSGAAGRNSMNDEARATGGLDPDPDRAPRQRSRWGRRSPYGYPRHDGAQGRTDPGGPDLCRARSRHQQLPPAGGAPDRRRLPRRRRLLAHRPPRRGRVGVRPPQRGGDRAHHRGARHLPRQDAQPRRHARPADRHRGLPRGRERRRVPRPRRATRPGSSSRSSTARPRRGWPSPAARR